MGGASSPIQDNTSTGFHVDDLYEFAAPKYFDFAANMKESGSVVDQDSEADLEWFEMNHSPAGKENVTPRRPVKLYHGSVSSKKSHSKTTNKTPASSDTVIPGSIKASDQSFSSFLKNVSSDWDQVPSPETTSVETNDCDVLLAELGMSPMPKGVLTGKREKRKSGQSIDKSPVKRVSPRKRRSSSPSKQKITHSLSIKPSPLRQQVYMQNPDESADDPVKNKRNSLYRQLFQQKPAPAAAPLPKTASVAAKLKVGADMLPSKSVKPLTIPREFSFQTDCRLKRTAPKEISYKAPRAPVINRQKIVRPPTRPISPKFSAKVRIEKRPQPTVKCTQPPVTRPITIPKAPNFATRPVTKRQTENLPKAVPRPAPRVTIPKSPKFSAIKSRRTTVVASSAATSFLASPFKARPAPKFGKPFEPVRPHKHTKPVDFKLPGEVLTSMKKMKLGDTPVKSVNQPMTPVKKSSNVGPAPRSVVRERKVTKPHSPKLSTRVRAQTRPAAAPQ